MIRKVIRADNIGRTVQYLFGPGRSNEHTNPHLVAAWDPAWLSDPRLVASLATAAGRRGLIAQLDAPRILHEVTVPGGHVYHVPLSLPADDGLLGDRRWRQVVEDAIARLGFGPDRHGRGGCRWIAVHHGLSANGNDHVHVVVQLVRGDGRVANLYRDWPKWDAVCQAAEVRWGLTQTRRAGAGQRALSRAEIERSRRTHREPARRDLAHRVRAAAAAAAVEAAFPAQLRRAGVLAEPRVSDGRVVGYRVALAADGEPLWLSGSQLARDLSLPQLRTRWQAQAPHWDRLTTRAWRRTTSGRRDPPSPDQPGDLRWKTARRVLVDATEHLETLDRGHADQWNQHLGDSADLLAALSRRLEPEPGPLYHAGHHLARAAQPDRTHRRPPTPPCSARPILLDAARIIACSSAPAQTATIAAVVLLAYGLVSLLDHLATQHTTDHARRRQLQLATTRLAEHPAVANQPPWRPDRQTTVASRQQNHQTDRPHRTTRHQPSQGPGRSR